MNNSSLPIERDQQNPRIYIWQSHYQSFIQHFVQTLLFVGYWLGKISRQKHCIITDHAMLLCLYLVSTIDSRYIMVKYDGKITAAYMCHSASMSLKTLSGDVLTIVDSDVTTMHETLVVLNLLWFQCTHLINILICNPLSGYPILLKWYQICQWLCDHCFDQWQHLVIVSTIYKIVFGNIHFTLWWKC